MSNPARFGTSRPSPMRSATLSHSQSSALPSRPYFLLSIFHHAIPDFISRGLGYFHSSPETYSTLVTGLGHDLMQPGIEVSSQNHIVSLSATHAHDINPQGSLICQTLLGAALLPLFLSVISFSAHRSSSSIHTPLCLLEPGSLEHFP